MQTHKQLMNHLINSFENQMITAKPVSNTTYDSDVN